MGRVLEVLVEGNHEETELVFKGRHQGQAPEVDGGVLIVGGEPKVHTLQSVRITQGQPTIWVGEVVEGAWRAAIRSFEDRQRKKGQGGA